MRELKEVQPLSPSLQSNQTNLGVTIKIRFPGDGEHKFFGSGTANLKDAGERDLTLDRQCLKWM